MVKMNGINTMSKGELVILCEKLGIDDSGKTVQQMRTALNKYYEEHEDEEPALKKAKPDPSSTKAPSGPPVCGKGDKCPELHSLKHRMAFKHTGFRDNPFKCRDGVACPKLKDPDHLVKYAHEDDLDKVCKDGANCDQLHLMDHRLKFEHPGFRAQPVECRNGLTCPLIGDKTHLHKYAHVDKGSGSTSVPDTKDDSHSMPPPPPPPPPPKKAASPAKAPAAKGKKTMDDFPLDQAEEAKLIPIDNDSEEFWDLEEKFAANLQGRNEDYVEKRIKAGKKPLRFILASAERVVNPTLEGRYEVKKAELMELRDSKDCRERVSFHGTHPKNLKSILKTGLLRFKHPLNPCKTQVDAGYFGTNQKGIYVSRYADYTLKYSNRVCAVEPGDEVKTVLFKTLPGKSKHIPKMCGAIDPTEGFDSHSSPTFLEWYLFDEAQACPTYVLKVKAVEDTRTAADDE